MNPELLKQALIAALMKQQGIPGVPPPAFPPQADPSLVPTTEAQRAAMRKGLAK